MRVANVFLLLFFMITITLAHGGPSNKKHYIVYLGQHSHPTSESVIKANHEMLASVTGSLYEAEEVALHHYTRSFRGFSAMLTEEQAQQLAECNSVVSVFESRMNKLHITHSWEFLGVNSYHSELHMASLTSDAIIGVIDTGIWPESDSFNDEGLGPVPKKFKGACVAGEKFKASKCNRKIIGARYYYKGFEAKYGPLDSFGHRVYRSARDSDGHGAHTASTIAGSVVPNVSLHGMAQGTARGGAPNARLAIYKTCWFGSCDDADILAAMDDAIDDGVDVLSISLGPRPPQPSYFRHAIAIGAFHAFQRGIIVSCSAGNSYFARTATNVAPWILTVAASSVDREFNSNIFLGNSKVLKGFALNPLEMERSYGLIAGSDAAAPGVTAKNASFCNIDDLDHTKIKGKIVVCEVETLTSSRVRKSMNVQQAGGVGIILIDPAKKDMGYEFVIPGTMVGREEAKQLQAYMKGKRNLTARIAPTITVLKTKPAPAVAVFSSQGPNVITPDIIKPDITAPGLNILAAWSPVAPDAIGKVNYKIISGTSMSCPHVSAVAAILKSYHPTWSPAAIMSAIMTTATVIDNSQKMISRHPNGTQATPFDYGSGHINPTEALNPGLVYDFNSNDIINFLCSTGAGPTQLKNLTRKPTNCQKPAVPSYDFNYPSIGVSDMRGSVTVRRTVTFYGNEPTVYAANVDYPPSVKITVIPAKLKFTREGERVSFRLDIKPLKTSNGKFEFGALTWSNGVHKVRSPIALNVLSL